MKTKPPAQPTVSVAIIEDDPIRLVGLRSLLDATSSIRLTATSIGDIATHQNLDILLLRNSGIRVLETVATLRVIRPELRIVVTGIGVDNETILKVIASGAKGYVDEAAPTPDLVQAIHTVHSGSVWFPRRVISMLIERSRGLLGSKLPITSSCLTSREKQVLEMLVEGRSNKEIGTPLGIEERTVKAHVAKLMRKVGVKNRIELSVHAISHSLVSTPTEG
jgi:DNA-binding NarL/FixJ family response regulator